MAQINLADLSTAEHGWRERYPYDHRMPRDKYEELKLQLQIELLKPQKHCQRTGARHVLMFEGP